MKKSTGDFVFDFFIYLFLLIVLFVTLYPIYYVLIISLNDATDSTFGGIYFFPRVPTISNYIYFFRQGQWLQAFWVSVLRTISSAVLVILYTCLFAYALSFKNLLGRKIYMSILIFSMYFSGGIIPTYVLYRFLGLLNSFAVYVIPGMISAFFVIIAISFFQAIPIEMIESARIDGSNELTIFAKIILPVSTPIIATIGLFSAVGNWNSWIDSAFFVQKSELRTLSYRLIEVINSTQRPSDLVAEAAGSRMLMGVQTTQSVTMTAMIISVFPIMCVYPFLQKYFVKGITIGSVKG